MKTKAKILQEIFQKLYHDHREMSVKINEQLHEQETPFKALRLAFKQPRVENRTYRIHGLEIKKFSILPTNSKTKRSTKLLGVRTNASFFGYDLSEVNLNYVKLQKDGLDEELLRIERSLHEEFSNQTRILMASAEVDMVANKIINAETDFHLAASVSNWTSSWSTRNMHSGYFRGIKYVSQGNSFCMRVDSKYQGKQTIDNEHHIVNVWDR